MCQFALVTVILLVVRLEVGSQNLQKPVFCDRFASSSIPFTIFLGLHT